MMQIGVTVYCLLLWAGIVFGEQMPQSVPHLLVLILLSAIMMIPLAPGLARLLLRSLTAAPNAPPRLRYGVIAVESRIPGAPGTPGAAHPRAPDAVVALA